MADDNRDANIEDMVGGIVVEGSRMKGVVAEVLAVHFELVDLRGADTAGDSPCLEVERVLEELRVVGG